MPYQSSGNIANLLLRRGQIRSQEERALGDINARMYADVGKTIGGTIRDVAQYKGIEEPRLREQEAQRKEAQMMRDERARVMRGEEQRRALESFAPEGGTFDPALVASELRKTGYSDIAAKAEQEYASRADQETNRILQRINIVRDPAARAAAMLNEVKNSKNPEQTYNLLMPGIKEAVGAADKSLVNEVPQVWTGNEENIRGLTAMANDVSATLDKRKQDMEWLSLVRKNAADAITLAKAENQYVAQGIARTNGQESLDQTLGEFRRLNISEDTISKYVKDGKWTPEVQKLGRQGVMDDDELAKLGLPTIPKIGENTHEINNRYFAKVAAYRHPDGTPLRDDDPEDAKIKSTLYNQANNEYYAAQRNLRETSGGGGGGGGGRRGGAAEALGVDPAVLAQANTEYNDYVKDYPEQTEGGAPVPPKLTRRNWLYDNYQIGLPDKDYPPIRAYAADVLKRKGGQATVDAQGKPIPQEVRDAEIDAFLRRYLRTITAKLEGE